MCISWGYLGVSWGYPVDIMKISWRYHDILGVSLGVSCHDDILRISGIWISWGYLTWWYPGTMGSVISWDILGYPGMWIYIVDIHEICDICDILEYPGMGISCGYPGISAVDMRGYPLWISGDILWISMISWDILGYPGMGYPVDIPGIYDISWDIMRYHEISWDIMRYHGISCGYPWDMWYPGISWNIMEYPIYIGYILGYPMISWDILGHRISAWIHHVCFMRCLDKPTLI